MLPNNLRYLRKQRKETQEHLADALGVKRSTYSDYEQGKTEPTTGLLLKLSNHYSLTPTELLTVDLGTPLFRERKSESPSVYHDGMRVVVVTVNEAQKENIELVSSKAVAGYSNNLDNPEFIQNLPRFNLPWLSEGAYRAFEIQGKSMPPISEGFIVVGKYVEHWQDIKDGKRYVLVLKNEGVVFKRVVNEVGKNKKLVLCSDNPEFLPFTISVHDVLEAWNIVTYVGYPEDLSDTNEAIFSKLQSIEQKMNLLIVNPR